MYRKYIIAEHEDKAHAKDPNDYRYARLKIYAPIDSDLHEITMTYIKKLDNNGAWDFDIQYIEEEHLNIVTFKWNGGVIAVDAINELHFPCEHTIQSEWKVDLIR